MDGAWNPHSCLRGPGRVRGLRPGRIRGLGIILPVPAILRLVPPLLVLLLLPAFLSTACSVPAHLLAVPADYTPAREVLRLPGPLEMRSATRGTAYALERVLASVAHADDSLARDFTVNFAGLSFRRRVYETVGGIATKAQWKRVSLFWVHLADCTARSGLSGTTAEFRAQAEVCDPDGCKVVFGDFNVPMNSGKSVSDFVAGARVLAGVDPDPDPRRLEEPPAP